MKKITKIMIKTQMPVTPASAMNFNFYILETSVGGVYASAIMITMK